MSRYLTPQQLLFIHARLIDTTGGGHGLRDLGLLESAVARPQATFDGVSRYVPSSRYSDGIFSSESPICRWQ